MDLCGGGVLGPGLRASGQNPHSSTPPPEGAGLAGAPVHGRVTAVCADIRVDMCAHLRACACCSLMAVGLGGEHALCLFPAGTCKPDGGPSGRLSAPLPSHLGRVPRLRPRLHLLPGPGRPLRPAVVGPWVWTPRSPLQRGPCGQSSWQPPSCSLWCGGSPAQLLRGRGAGGGSRPSSVLGPGAAEGWGRGRAPGQQGLAWAGQSRRPPLGAGSALHLPCALGVAQHPHQGPRTPQRPGTGCVLGLSAPSRPLRQRDLPVPGGGDRAGERAGADQVRRLHACGPGGEAAHRPR